MFSNFLPKIVPPMWIMGKNIVQPSREEMALQYGACNLRVCIVYVYIYIYISQSASITPLLCYPESKLSCKDKDHFMTCTIGTWRYKSYPLASPHWMEVGGQPTPRQLFLMAQPTSNVQEAGRYGMDGNGKCCSHRIRYPDCQACTT